MKFYSLASGSTGNCILVDNGREKLLIDVGISYAKIKEKLNYIGYDVSDIDYILITHTHNDHIRAINSFSMTKVYSAIKVPGLVNKLVKNEIVALGEFKILPFPLSHDVDCCGYRISSGNESLVYLTDTGYVNSKVIKQIENATYYIFESNHDINMLMNSSRPSFLKTRILSDNGHLSNEDASEIITNLLGDNTKEICLAHISRDCNTKKLAYDCLIKNLHERNIQTEILKINTLDAEEILQGGNLDEKDYSLV